MKTLFLKMIRSEVFKKISKTISFNFQMCSLKEEMSLITEYSSLAVSTEKLLKVRWYSIKYTFICSIKRTSALLLGLYCLPLICLWLSNVAFLSFLISTIGILILCIPISLVCCGVEMRYVCIGKSFTSHSTPLNLKQ